MANFEIKKGMCFFIEKPATTQPIPNTSEFTPEKNRPYMVVSNNKCNATSTLIHVAPVITREYNEKHWWNVPFKSTNNRNSIVNISEIMLIEKNLCTTQNYAMSISDLTMNNAKLMDNIAVAIRRQFALDNDSQKYDSYEIEDVPATKITTNNVDVSSVSTPYPQMPTFNITINVNGLPSGATVTTSTADSNSITLNTDITSDVPSIDNTENTVETPKKKVAKAIPDKPKKVATKSTRVSGKHFTDEEREKFTAFIRTNYRKFGGSMTASQISKVLNISGVAVSYYIKKINSDFDKKKNPTRVSLPEKMRAQFMSDYVSHGTKYILEHYSDCGFVKAKQVYDTVERLKAMLAKEREAVR